MSDEQPATANLTLISAEALEALLEGELDRARELTEVAAAADFSESGQVLAYETGSDSRRAGVRSVAGSGDMGRPLRKRLWDMPGFTDHQTKTEWSRLATRSSPVPAAGIRPGHHELAHRPRQVFSGGQDGESIDKSQQCGVLR